MNERNAGPGGSGASAGGQHAGSCPTGGPSPARPGPPAAGQGLSYREHGQILLEANGMETMRILERPEGITWDYDEEADVLHLSVGQPRPTIGVDIGEGTVVRYDEQRREVVGLTVVGLRARLLRGLAEPAPG